MDKLRRRARALRNTPTDAEDRLWQQLRRRQLAGFRFRRQMPLAGYIADFVCLDVQLIVELDGGQHDLAVAYDSRRTNWLESQGWTVLRFWNNEIDCNEETVLENILQELNRRSPSP